MKGRRPLSHCRTQREPDLFKLHVPQSKAEPNRLSLGAGCIRLDAGRNSQCDRCVIGRRTDPVLDRPIAHRSLSPDVDLRKLDNYGNPAVLGYLP